jgi:hypothetical protein
MTAEIILTRGMVALVDDADQEMLAMYSWRAIKGIGRWYAMAWTPQVAWSRRALTMHRLVLGEPAADVDHVNGDGLDNRRSNLRIATDSQNGANRVAQGGGTSIYKGVCRRSGETRWRATVQVLGRKVNAGSHATEEEAARAYDALARQHFGPFAALNFPGPGEQPAHRRESVNA